MNRKSLRIAVFVREFPALSETFILNQVSGLVALGHDVTIFAERPRDEPRIHPNVARDGLIGRTRYLRMPRGKIPRVLYALVPLLRVLRHRPGTVSGALSIRRYGRDAWSLRLLYWSSLMAEEPPFDVIHCHFGPVGQLAAKLREIGAMSGILGTVFHGVDISAYTRDAPNYYYYLFPRGDVFLPISDNWRRRLVKLGCDPARIEVHHMGVEPHRYHFRPRRCEPDKVLRLLTVGRLVEKKGVEYALRAVALLGELGIAARYDVVGDGELRENLKALAVRLGISDRVNFRGWQDQNAVIRHMARNDVLLVPSVTTPDGDQEGIPVTLMEAMASGMLVVATNHSGIPELVKSGQSGILVPERDADGLADALANLVARPEIWSAMSRAARVRISDEFEIGVLNRALIRIYEMRLGGSGVHDAVVSDTRRCRSDAPIACHAQTARA
jgi:colanic acid/amylovoran biosynthesis glycosyltransferase